MPFEADQTIDELLERYLGLVDQYAALRDALAAAQQRTFHALARANFTADRGARYGRDQYDERMRASRRLAISRPAEHAPPTFAVTVEEETTGAEAQEEEEGDGSLEKAAEKRAAGAAAGNPIRWFGVLVPQALRDAQGESVRTVEDIVPQLVSVQAEMAHVEIEVRRARKKRAKASSGGKQQGATSTTAQAVSASS